MVKKKRDMKFRNADAVKWKDISPRSRCFSINVRDHEILVVWTRGENFSTMTMTHTWQRRQKIKTIECRSMTFAKCLDSLMRDRGIVWKSVMHYHPSGLRSPSELEPPPITEWTEPKVGRPTGYKHTLETREKMSKAALKRAAVAEAKHQLLQEQLKRGKAVLKKRKPFHRSMADVPDED